MDSPDFVTDIPEVFIAAGAFEESTDVEMERELFFNLFSFDSEALEDEGELFASFESMEDFDVCFPIVMLELASNFDGSSDGFEAVILLAEAGVVLRPILALPTDRATGVVGASSGASPIGLFSEVAGVIEFALEFLLLFLCAGVFTRLEAAGDFGDISSSFFSRRPPPPGALSPDRPRKP